MNHSSSEVNCFSEAIHAGKVTLLACEGRSNAHSKAEEVQLKFIFYYLEFPPFFCWMNTQTTPLDLMSKSLIISLTKHIFKETKLFINRIVS